MKNFQDLTISDYLGIVRRRIWYLILPAVLISIGTVVFVWRLPSIYKSETTILVSQRFLPEDYIGSLVRESVIDRIEFVKQQVRSRTFIQRIAEEFQLVPPGGNPEGVVNAVIASTDFTVSSANTIKLGYMSSDPNVSQLITRRLAERVMALNDSFRKDKVVVADQFLDEELRKATDDLSQAEQKLRDFNRQHFPGIPEQGANPEVLNTLQGQITALDTDLEKAYEQRKNFERMLDEQRQLKMAAQPATQRPSPPPPPSSVERAPTQAERNLAAKRNDLATAVMRYTPIHPDVQRLTREVHQLEAEVANEAATREATAPTPSSPAKVDKTSLPEVDVTADFYQVEIRQELDQWNRDIARKQESRKDIANKLAQYGRRLNAPAEVMQELDTLSHQREDAKQAYSYLSTKKLNSDLAGKVDTNINNETFKIIDAANLPQSPISPNRPMIAAIGCIGGLFFGLGLVFAREAFDPTLSDEQASAAELKLPILTSIPRVGPLTWKERRLERKRKKASLAAITPGFIENGSNGKFSLEAADTQVRDLILDPFTLAGEQCRVMRANLSGLQKQRGLKSLVITSAIPNEGKTFAACCLAGILAQEKGKKVLLIDADLRTANAQHVLGIELPNSHPGLCEVLRGTSDVDRTLLKCTELNLFFMPSGNPVENPAELLSSPRLEQTMYELTEQFDWVIVDSPPVLPIADANLLILVSDATVLVIRADKTPTNLIKESIARIGRDRICGVLMNCVRSIKSTHYYGRYYNRLEQVKK